MDGVIRTPDQRVRVFVSSTLQELAPERTAARQAITQLRLIPVMFELGARPHPPQDLYRSYLDQSHVFVGIYWQSYGWVAPGSTISGIEDELLLAGDRPRLIYVKEPAPQRDPGLEDMLARIRQDGRVSYKHFDTPESLADLLADDLAILVSERFEAPVTSDGRLSSGTLTFLFADLERSTPLLEELGDDYTDVLRTYQALVSSSTESCAGRVESRPGDGMFCVFADAVSAVAAAVEIQREMSRQSWPRGTTVRARIGIHTGLATERPEGYVGIDIHRAARIGDAAHGGQILVSGSTAHLIENESSRQGWVLRDLGDFDLRGLSRPEQLVWVGAEGIPDELSPPRARRVGTGTLPTPLTSLIGRERELAEVRPLLTRPEVRLVTLTGAGGIGKSRMAIALAEALSGHFADGVTWVPLASVSDPSLVPGSVGQALGLLDSGRQPILDTVFEYLSDKEMLIVLDNYEQLTGASSLVIDLLDRSPGLTILVTSRSPLRVRGEHEIPVGVLAYPEAGEGDLGREDAYPAVQLFIERALAANPRLEMTSDRLEAIADITSRLDGLPLAIELAAARTRYLDPRALAGRMTSLLDLLSRGARDLPERQRTMRATIGWSDELLDESSRLLLRRLALFRGTPDLDVVDGVVDWDGRFQRSLLDELETLADAGLITLSSGDDDVEPRVSMLRVVREYAAERLEAHAEGDTGRRAHAEFFLELAEEAEPHLWTPRRDCWRDHIERNVADVGAAFEMFRRSQDMVGVWRMAAALAPYIILRGPYGDSVRVMKEAGLAGDAQIPDGVSAHAAGGTLRGGGMLMFLSGDFPGAVPFLRRSVEVFVNAGEEVEAARARSWLGLAGISTGDPSAMVELAQARTAGDELGDLAAYAVATTFSAEVAQALGDLETAAALLQDAEERCRGADDRWLLGLALLGRGNLAIVTDDIDMAIPVTEECLALLTSEMPGGALWPQIGLGYCHLRREEPDVARKYFEHAVADGRRAGDKSVVLSGLIGLGGVAALEGEPLSGGRLLGAGEAIRDAIGYQLWSATATMYQLVQDLLARHGTAALVERGRAEGSRLGYEEAVALVGR